jgi:hypothetical protein
MSEGGEWSVERVDDEMVARFERSPWFEARLPNGNGVRARANSRGSVAFAFINREDPDEERETRIAFSRQAVMAIPLLAVEALLMQYHDRIELLEEGIKHLIEERAVEEARKAKKRRKKK